MEMERLFKCVAHGRPGQWEAICLDLDIAVQGETFPEVAAVLSEAVETYLEDALAEDDRTRERLLNRHVPFWVWLGYWTRTVWHFRPRASHGGEAQANFEVPCPA